MTGNERMETIELKEEELEVSKREVERGRVVVRTRIEEREELAEAALLQQEVEVERVPRDVVVEAMPDVREVDGVLIVPVVEERLVVTTELVLKEEIQNHQEEPHGDRSRAGAAPLGAGGNRAAARP